MTTRKQTAHPEGFRGIAGNQKPVVTLALFAFNQEKFISDAIDGAFAQTYQPLEIIISDDCSTDETFLIIENAVSNYKGPHLVRARRQTQNSGLINHVHAVASEMRGEIMVLAAGDDISTPNRVERLISEWAIDCIAMDSACSLMDESGNSLDTKWVSSSGAKQRLPWLREFSSEFFVYGASSAYHKNVIKALPPSKSKVYSEDTPLNIIAQLSSGGIHRCDSALVKYRVHENSISSKKTHVTSTMKAIMRDELKRPKEIAIQRGIYSYIVETLTPSLGLHQKLDLAELDRLIFFCDLRLRFYSAGLFCRLYMLIGSPLWAWLWLLPRVFGLNFYVFLKHFIMNFRSRVQSIMAVEK